MRTGGGADLNRHSYGYNHAHQRTSQVRPDLSTVTYTYDDIGQLRSANSSTEQLGYKYDAAFNLNVRTNNGVTTTFGVNVKNELTTQPNGTATYDGNGNLIADGVRTFSYDDENQLISVISGTTKSEFVYDGVSRLRIRKEYTGSGGASAATEAMVIGSTLSALDRNDASGWIGLRLTVGSASITVTELGRWVISGNSGTHTVKLVSSSGTDLGSVSINTSGKSVGFAYATLASPITLSANTSYYLVSQEFLGGDRWYEYDCLLDSSGAATVTSAAYNVGGGYVNVASAGNAYGPVNLRYTTSKPSLVSGASLSTTLRNDASGWVGLRLTVGSTALTVSELGRWVVSR